jgi:hypothetical protein
MKQLASLAVLALLAGALPVLAQTERISISTGGTGGVYYPLAADGQYSLKYVPGPCDRKSRAARSTTRAERREAGGVPMVDIVGCTAPTNS